MPLFARTKTRFGTSEIDFLKTGLSRWGSVSPYNAGHFIIMIFLKSLFALKGLINHNLGIFFNKRRRQLSSFTLKGLQHHHQVYYILLTWREFTFFAQWRHENWTVCGLRVQSNENSDLLSKSLDYRSKKV